MTDLQLIKSPEMWPHFPYLRVERRKDPRRGQATCFVKVSDDQKVEPKVMATHSWPPPEQDDLPLVLELDYRDWDSLFSEGWRPILPAWMQNS